MSAPQFLTDKTLFAASLDNADLIHVVDVDDTSQNPAGSSYRLTLAQLKAFVTPATPTLNEVLSAGNLTDGQNIIVSPADALAFQNTGATFTTYLTNDQATGGNRTIYLPIFDGTLTYKTTTLTQNYVLKGGANEAITSSSLIYDNGTNVGIGTTTLSALLTIKGTSNALADYSLISKNLAGTRGIELNNEGQFNLFGSLSISLGTATTSQRLNIADDSSNIVMRVDGASGATELGLGASNFARLRIYKQGDHGVQVGVSGSDDEYTAYSVYDGSNFRVRIEKSGNAGFGTGLVPSARLHSKGSTSDSSAYALKVDNSSSSALLYVRNDKFVGIGASSPTTSGGLFQVTQSSYDEVARFQGYFGGAFNAFVISKDGNIIAEQYSHFKQTVSLGGTLVTTAKLLYAPNDWAIEFGNTTINNDSVSSYSVIKSGYNKISFRDSTNAQMGEINYGAGGQGFMDVKTGYKVNGTSGFTGTGAYTNFTIQGGIITAAS